MKEDDIWEENSLVNQISFSRMSITGCEVIRLMPVLCTAGLLLQLLAYCCYYWPFFANTGLLLLY